MECKNFQEKWLDLISERLAETEAETLRAHRLSCASCEKETAALESVWASLDAARPVETPESLRHSTLMLLQGLLAEEQSAEVKRGLGLRQVIVSLFSGGALAFFGLWSLNLHVGLQAIPLAGLVACATWWTGLFALSLSLILGHYRHGKLQLRGISSIGAAGAGILLAGTYFCPKLALPIFWQDSVAGRLLMGAMGVGASHLTFGFLYALIPTLAVTLYFGRKLHAHWVRDGVLAAMGFLLLMFPNLYIQCSTLSLTLATLLFFGVILGSLGGALAGLGMHHFRNASA